VEAHLARSVLHRRPAHLDGSLAGAQILRAVLGGRLAGRDNIILGLFVEILKNRFADDQWFDGKDIADVGNVLLYFIELHRMNGQVRIVLTVDDPLLQCRKGFRPGHGRRINAPGLVRVEHDLVLRHPDHQSFQVFHGADGFLGVGQHPEAGVGPADDAHLGISDGVLDQFLADGTLGQLDGIIQAQDNVG